MKKHLYGTGGHLRADRLRNGERVLKIWYILKAEVHTGNITD